MKPGTNWTVLGLINWTKDFFESRKMLSCRRQAEDLLGQVLDLDRLHLYLQFDYVPTSSELALFRNFVQRRADGEPLQHLLGWQPFLGLKIKTDRRALIPRPETETLGMKLLERFKNAESAKIADLGTGTGCLALGLARLPGARIWATDCSGDALSLARENAVALKLEDRVEFLQGDWFKPLREAGIEGLDLVVSNPPYIAAGEAAGLAREVRDFEPAGALYSGTDGMEALRNILAGAGPFLKSGGTLALECGEGQPEQLKKETRAAGIWDEVWMEVDACGIERFVFARKAGV